MQAGVMAAARRLGVPSPNCVAVAKQMGIALQVGKRLAQLASGTSFAESLDRPGSDAH